MLIYCVLLEACETSPVRGSMETPESEQKLNEQPFEEGLSAMPCSPPSALLRSVKQWQDRH